MKNLLLLFLFISQAVTAQTINDGLSAYYPFNGNADDVSGNENHGTVNGPTLTTDRFGDENSAFLFDGVDDFIEVLDHESLDVENISISVWIKPTEFKSFSNGISNYSKYSGPISKTTQDPYNQSGISSASNNESLRFSAKFQAGFGSQPEYQNSIVLNQWQHIVYVVNNGVIKIFKDGELMLENNDREGNLLSTNNEPLLIGKTYWFPNYALLASYFTGKIDDIRIYNRELQDCEIETLYYESTCYKTIFDTVQIYDTITSYINNYIPQDSLVAYYPFSGDAKDGSGNANHGTVISATLTTDRFGNENSAYEFDGTNDFIQLPSDFDFPERTVSVWFQSKQYNTTQRIYYSDHNALENSSTTIDLIYDEGLEKNILRFICGGGQAEILSDTIEQEQWYHALITISTETVKAYLNGEFKGETSFVDHHSVDGFPNAFLACNREKNNYFFGGKIDDIMVFNRTLSESEIQSIFNEGTCHKTIFDTVQIFDTITSYINNYLPQDSLVAYYPFSGNAKDGSGNENHGTVNGATLTTDRFGNANSAFLFDGVDDYILLSSEFDFPKRTIGLWFNANNINTYNRLYISDNPNINYGSTKIWMNDYSGENVLMYTIWENEDNTIKIPIKENKWYYATISIDLNKIKVYLDGELIDSASNDYSHSVDGLEQAILGASRTGFNRYYDGKMDDIRIYNKALSDFEIKMLYHEGKSIEEIAESVIVYDTITHHDTTFYQVYDTTFINDTIYHQDTIFVSDTIPVKVYDVITVTDTLVIDVVISDIDPLEISTIKVYPNPTKEKVMIRLNDQMLDSEYKIRIVNETGSVIFESGNIMANDYEVNISQFGKKGLYFVQIINPNDIVIDTRKIVLQ